MRRHAKQRIAGIAARMRELLYRLEARLTQAEGGQDEADPGPAPEDTIEMVGSGAAAHPVRTVDLFGRAYLVAGVADDQNYLAGLGEHGSEETLHRVCSEFVADDGLVVDVGANIGITTLIAAGRTPRRTVYSIEAGPDVYARLAENIAANHLTSVHAYQFAVGSQAGTVAFTEFSAYGHVTVGDEHNARGSHIAVTMRTLDEFIETEQITSVDLVKIDVEGFERNVLEGYITAEERDRPLFYVEFNSWALSAFGRINPMEILEYVIDRFTDVRYFDGADLVRLDAGSKYTFLHRNLVEHGCVDDILFTNDPQRLVPRNSPQTDSSDRGRPLIAPTSVTP